MYEVNNERNTDCELGYDRTLSIATMTVNGGNGAADDSLRNYKVIRVGDIAFEGHANKVHAYGRFVLNDAGDGLMSPRFSCLRPIVEQRYSFWKYYIPREETMRPILVKATKSGTMMNELVPDDLMRESVLVPSLAEQEVIGGSLSQLDSLITLHQRKCQYRGLYGYLSWEQRKLGEIATRHDNLRIPITAKDRIPGDTPYYGANGIQDYVEGYTHEGEFVLVAEDGAADLDNYPVQLISGLSWVNNHAHVIKAIPDVAQNRFIMHLIKSMDIASCLVGGTRSKLNAEVLMGIELKLPSNSEQIYIGALLSTLDSLITLHQ